MQEPRILTLEEYKSIAERPLDQREPLWIEWRDGSGAGWRIPQRAYERYGADWVAWTNNPNKYIDQG